ncbi:GNAT family N-acetyltransferase [Gordonia sp. CPCC 205333]|uniref:GNAT family N-acetyltransferase n=1 Tax=Gordonia sp. CPCC 205333 TaxID=3140790 RepID=UPI003AF40949
MAEIGTLHVKHSPGQERYEAYLLDDDGLPGERVGYVDYVAEVEQIVLTHTVVPERYAGQGIAGQLVKFVLDDVRASGKRIVPVCTYVRSFIKRHPEYADLAVPVPQ